jgi:hypothetical protein
MHNLELSLAQDGKNVLILVNSSPEFRTRPVTDNIGFNRMQATPFNKNFSLLLIYIS